MILLAEAIGVLCLVLHYENGWRRNPNPQFFSRYCPDFSGVSAADAHLDLVCGLLGLPAAQFWLVFLWIFICLLFRLGGAACPNAGENDQSYPSSKSSWYATQCLANIYSFCGSDFYSRFIFSPFFGGNPARLPQ